jgi:hypothetical protein
MLTALRKITAGGSGGAPIRDPLPREEDERSNHHGNSSFRGRERFLMTIVSRNGQLTVDRKRTSPSSVRSNHILG